MIFVCALLQECPFPGERNAQMLFYVSNDMVRLQRWMVSIERTHGLYQSCILSHRTCREPERKHGIHNHVGSPRRSDEESVARGNPQALRQCLNIGIGSKLLQQSEQQFPVQQLISDNSRGSQTAFW
jgi:hypothetical protein